MSTINYSSAIDLEEGKTIAFAVTAECSIPVRWSRAPLQEAQEAVLIDRPERLEVLRRLDDYPHLRGLIDAGCLDYARQRKLQVRQWLSEGIWVFGAYKVGLKLSRLARASGIAVEGFLDNDRAKQSTVIEGIQVHHPSDTPLENAVVLIASGRHSNSIHAQLSMIRGIRLVNMSEYLYALEARHAARFVDAGAAAGDTLCRLEYRFGPVKQAWLFEPELPAYYEALKNFAQRADIWLFNMGLDATSSRTTYQPALSY